MHRLQGLQRININLLHSLCTLREIFLRLQQVQLTLIISQN